MKQVTAIIKPFKLDGVQEALRDLGIQGMTVTEVSGFGRQGGHSEVYRGTEYRIDLLPKLCVEVVIDDADVDDVIDAIRSGAATGKIGDGKIWVVHVEEIVRLRTMERGPEAL